MTEERESVPATPKVTIGIAFRNPGRHFEMALRSVFSQTLTDWELLLVDDGSDDGSLILARSVRDARVSLVTDGLHLGLPARLNQIALLARGEYLARMDADDLMHPDRIRRQVEALDADQTLDVTGTATYTMNATGVVNGVRGLTRVDTSPAAVVARGLLVHPTVTGRRSWFRRHPYDERFVRAEDRELWCRTANVSRFALVAEPLYFYREGGTGALAKYIKSCRTDRAIYRRYGPGGSRVALDSATPCDVTPQGRCLPFGRVDPPRSRFVSAAQCTAQRRKSCGCRAGAGRDPLDTRSGLG